MCRVIRRNGIVPAQITIFILLASQLGTLLLTALAEPDNNNSNATVKAGDGDSRGDVLLKAETRVESRELVAANGGSTLVYRPGTYSVERVAYPGLQTNGYGSTYYSYYPSSQYVAGYRPYYYTYQPSYYYYPGQYYYPSYGYGGGGGGLGGFGFCLLCFGIG